MGERILSSGNLGGLSNILKFSSQKAKNNQSYQPKKSIFLKNKKALRTLNPLRRKTLLRSPNPLHQTVNVRAITATRCHVRPPRIVAVNSVVMLVKDVNRDYMERFFVRGRFLRFQHREHRISNATPGINIFVKRTSIVVVSSVVTRASVTMTRTGTGIVRERFHWTFLN